MFIQIKEFQEIKSVFSKYIDDQNSIDLIENAYKFVAQKHQEQFRKSGDPYLYHLMQTAYYLSTWGMDANTIAAGFLHDVVEDQGINISEIENKFNKEVAFLVDSVTKVNIYDRTHEDKTQSSNMRKIILAMAKDIRVILIKIADRYHNIQTLEYLSPDKRAKIAMQTDQVYLPLAMRLGLEDVVNEMNTKIFMYLYPDLYKEISTLIKEEKSTSNKNINLLVEELKQYFLSKNINTLISWRIKNIRSIAKKIYDKEKNIDQIYDINGIRIIVETIEECYLVLGYIQSKYFTFQSRFKDYIANPKKNLYQSLHLTLSFKKKAFEVQIRTKKMDACCTNGFASHWMYKENNQKSDSNLLIESKLHWFQEELKKSSKKKTDKSISLSDFHKIIFEDHIYAITPKEMPVELPKGATVLDFAYKIHTNLAETCVGAIINGELKPLDYQLNSGDIVNLKTSKNQSPNDSWLEKVVTTSAKAHIKKFLKQKTIDDKKQIIKNGKEIFQEYIKKNERYKVYVSSNNFLSFTKFNSWDDLYIKIGLNHQTPYMIIKRYEKIEEDKRKSYTSPKTFETSQSSKRSPFNIDGLINVKIELAKCCLPIPGDEVIGAITKFNGIKAHRKGCPNLNNVKDEKILEYITWNDSYNYVSEFSTKIQVDLVPESVESEVFPEIIFFTNRENISVQEFHCKKTSFQFLKIDIKISVKSLDNLNEIIKKMKTLKGITNVQRIF